MPVAGPGVRLNRICPHDARWGLRVGHDRLNRLGLHGRNVQRLLLRALPHVDCRHLPWCPAHPASPVPGVVLYLTASGKGTARLIALHARRSHGGSYSGARALLRGAGVAVVRPPSPALVVIRPESSLYQSPSLR